MAQNWRNRPSQQDLNNIPAQFNSPTAQRIASGVVNNQQRAQDAVATAQAQQQERAERAKAQEIESLQKRQADLQEETRKQQVRAGAAAGMETTTDIHTGKTVIDTHADGAAKFKPGPVGNPIEQPVVNKEVAAIPGLGDVVNSGAIGRPAEYTGTELVQNYRNDRGGETQQPLPTQTDKETGEVFRQMNDPATGAPIRKVLGEDSVTKARIERTERLKTDLTNLDLQRSQFQQAHAMFTPQWEPVKKEYEDAERELKKLTEKSSYQRRGQGWVKIDPDTGKESIAASEEVARHQQRFGEAKGRMERARKAYDPLAPQADGMERHGKALEFRRFELAEKKNRIELDLPDDDGGVAAILAGQEIGQPVPPDFAQVLGNLGIYIATPGESAPPAPQPSVGEEAGAAAGVAAGAALGAATAQPDRPLVPSEPDQAQLFGKAFAGLVNPEQFTLGDSGNGFQMIKRDGRQVGSIDTGRDGVPKVVLNGDWSNRDLQLKAAIGSTTGIPLYLADSPNRKDLTDEAAWSAQVFQTARRAPLINDDGGVQSAGLDDRTLVLKEMGADPESIALKVRSGDISIQTGEAIFRDLYGTTMKAPDPAAPATRDAWLAQADGETKQRAAKALKENDTAALNALTTQRLNDWLMENRWRPGVTFQTRQEAEKALTGKLRTGEQIAAVGGDLIEAGGSILGMLGAGGAYLGLEAGAVTGDEDFAAARDRTGENFLRQSKNTWRGWEQNRQKWFTAAGEERMTGFKDAFNALDRQVSLQDSATAGINDPDWKANYKQRIDAVTDAVFAIHQMNPEKGWEVTREDLDPSSNPALAKLINGYALTGDRSLLEAYRTALMEDHGTRQAQGYIADLTLGAGRLTSGIVAGANAAPEEIGIELASTILTAGIGAAVFGGAKTARIAAKGGEVIAASGRIARFRIAALGIKNEMLAVGMVENTLAKPANLLGKTSNALVKGLKVGAADAATESLEEAAMAASDRNATAQSITGDAGMGALAGFFMGPLIGGPVAIAEKSRAAFESQKSASRFADYYNRTNSGTPGFVPITPRDALTAMTLMPEERATELKEFSRTATTELIAAVEAASANPGPETWNALSRAQAKSLIAIDMMASDAALRTEAVTSIQGLDPAVRDLASAVAKVAGGRPDLLTGAERSAAAGKQTRDGKPFFASVNGRDVVTDAGRAEAMLDFPAVGAMIQTTESQAIFDAAIAPPQANGPVTGQDTSGTTGAAPSTASAASVSTAVGTGTLAPGAASAASGGNGSVPDVAAGSIIEQAAAGASLASMEAAEFAAYQSSASGTPDAGTVVQQAFASGQPVSVSMANAAGAEIPSGYTRQGNVLAPPAGTQGSPTFPALPDQTAPAADATDGRAVAESVKAEIERTLPRLAGRIVIVDTAVGSGGASVELDGKIRLHVGDVQTAITRANGDAAAVTESLTNIVQRHEAVHVVQVDAVRTLWEEAGSPGKFEDYFRQWYADLAPQLLTPEAIAAAQRIYGAEYWDSIANDGLKAAEFVRMLIEAKLDPERADQFSELFRATRMVGKDSPLARLIRAAIDILRKLQLTGAAAEHVAKLEELYREMTEIAPQQSTPLGIAFPANPPQTAPIIPETAETIPESSETVANEDETIPSDTVSVDGFEVVTTGDTSQISFDGQVLWRGATDRVQAELADLQAARTAPMRVTGEAIAAAISRAENPPRNLRKKLEAVAEEISEYLETLPPAERRPAIDAAIDEWVQEQSAPKLVRQLDAPARTRAYQILNSAEYPAITALFQSATKIAPRPNLISLILARKKAGAKLTERETALLRNDPEYDGQVTQSQFTNAGTGKVAREIVSILTAKRGEGVAPDVMAGYVREGMTASEMWGELWKELNAIANGTLINGREQDPNREFTEAEIRQELSKGTASPAVAERQAEAFEAANVPENGEAFNVEDFTQESVGATVTVDGEEMRIAEVIMDSLGVEVESVVLDDHTRFGRQVLENGETVYIQASEVEEGALFSSPLPASARRAPVDLPDAIIAHDLGRATSHPEYTAAKAGDPNAALRMARDMVTPQMRAAVKALIGDAKPIVVPVLAIEESGNNMIPAAVAVRLAETLDLQTDSQIVQAVRAHRSEKSALDRVFAQPQFSGPVTAGESYLLVDDTLTQGGTFAAIADHITASGGRVVGAVALTGKQYSATLRLSESLREQVRARLGDVEDVFRRATGYGFDRLTESEARTLVKFGPLERVRARILEEGNDGRDGLDEVDEGQAPPSLGSSPLPAAEPAKNTAGKLAGPKVDGEWNVFNPASETLAIPRAEMPQIRADDRSALVQFLRARGISYQIEDVLPGTLRPTQAEYSPSRVKKAREFTDGDRSILISSDHHVVDGHHQWMKDIADNPSEPMKVIRFGAPVLELLPIIREMPSVEVPSNPATSLQASPLPDAPAAVDAALAGMPPIYRQVFEAVNGGAMPADVMKRFKISEAAVTNILNAVRSRIATATTAATADGLVPAMRDGKFDGGRPDLALSTNPTVAAVDQIRNESGVPDVRADQEVFSAADAMLEADYQGAYDTLLAKARNQDFLTDVETEAAKRIISRETLSGKIQAPADRVKIALLIHGYRDIGTEQARSLRMRRDPHKNPAQRHAQFIAEALFTPDPDTREMMRKQKGSPEEILKGWLARVDAIRGELKAQGIDLDASLANFREKQELREQAEKESPRARKVIEESIRKLTKREQAVIEAIRSGALVSKAAFTTGLSNDEVKVIYTRFMKDIRSAMTESAKRFLAGSLASSPLDLMGTILNELGLPDISLIDDSQPGFVDRRNEKPKKPREKKPEPAPAAPLTPEQQTAMDQAWERFKAASPSTWATFWQKEAETLTPLVGQVGFERFKGAAMTPWRDRWQTEMEGIARPAARMTFDEWITKPENTEKIDRQGELFRDAVNELKGSWSETRTFSGQGELIRDEINETTGTFDTTAPNREGSLFPQPINETTGEFDLNDPVAVKAVLDAFAVARGGKMDALMEWWRMSILTGPQTHIVNMGSNVLNAAFTALPKRALEASINTALGLVGQGSDKSATFGEFAPMARNLSKGFQIAARNALRSWKLESRTFEAYARAEALQLDFTGVGAEYIPPALGGKIGKIMRSLSFRAMTTADEFMKSLYAQMETAAQAHRMAKAAGLKGAEYDARLTELMEPGSEAWIRAIDETKRVMFQEDIDGTNPRAIRRIDQFAELMKHGRSLPWIGRPLTFILPFIDTPTNIFKMAVEMSPLGGALAVIDGARALKRRVLAGNLTPELAKQEAERLYDRARFVQDLANQTIGIAVFLALKGMVEADDDDESALPIITGTVPYKSTKRGERDNAHAVMPAQTLRLGNLQVSYSRIEPFATVLASLADLHVEMNRNGGFTPGVGSTWLARFKDQAKDKTFLQGISNLINAIEDPERWGEQLVANTVTGFVPNIIRQPIRESDTFIRDTNPRADEGFFTSVAKRVGFSIAPQFAPIKQDVWGNDIETNRGGEIGGFRVADAAFRIFDPSNATLNREIDPLDAYIFRWNKTVQDPKDSLGLTPIGSSVSTTVDGKTKKFALTVEEQRGANKRAGTVAREFLGDGWDPAKPTAEGIERIKEAVADAQKAVREELRMKKIAEGAKPE